MALGSRHLTKIIEWKILNFSLEFQFFLNIFLLFRFLFCIIYNVCYFVGWNMKWRPILVWNEIELGSPIYIFSYIYIIEGIITMRLCVCYDFDFGSSKRNESLQMLFLMLNPWDAQYLINNVLKLFFSLKHM